MTGINSSHSDSDGSELGVVLAAASGTTTNVQTTQDSGTTTEEYRDRRICNCEECHRIASIPAGVGGLCVECFSERMGEVGQ